MEQFVLVADDDQNVLYNAQRAIEQQGFIPVLASDGKQAYKALSSNIPILAAFLNLDMPYIPGIELIRFIKSDSRLRSIPVIVIVGGTAPARLTQALDAGAIASIPKPFNQMKFGSMLSTIAGLPNERSDS